MTDRRRSTLDGLEEMLWASKKAEAGLVDAARKVVRGFEEKQREFHQNKQRIEDDIKRGARLSKGRIPF